MPRRSSTRFQLQPQPSSPPPPPQPTNGDNPPTGEDPMLQLRTQWKWAAFSQFFFTFNHLFAMNDVSLNDIEGDLIRGSCIVLPRIMQRLLYTLSYDRKVSLDNWQTALRKQYRKRDPAANPIGPEPREDTPEPEEGEEQEENVAVPDATKDVAGDVVENGAEMEHKTGPSDESGPLPVDPESTRASTLERGVSESVADSKALSAQPSGLDTRAGTVDGTEREDTQGPSDQPQTEDQEESKDWLDLPMLTKLDSMHILTEWQFQNPTRLRTLMRTDDETATWRIEPIGYDSKKNAYWLIGADRLWLQRPIPRPPRPKPTGESLKRKRGANPTKSSAKANAKSTTKSKNAKRPRLQAESSPPSSPSKAGGRGSRAAKHEANLKLDQQAKELAALNKQAAALAKEEAGLRASKRGLPTKGGAAGSSASARASKRGGEGSPQKPMGTRVSKRLRGAAKEEDEWQAVPDEWLNGEGSSAAANGKGGGRNGKGKAKAAVKDEEDGEEGDEQDEEEDDRQSGKRLKTGLESDGSEISDLTELSDLSEEKTQSNRGDGEHVEESGENVKQEMKGEEQKSVAPAPPADDRGLEEPLILPEGFVEWETICVTLYEWDHIPERFAKATHYTEKALYKVLVNTIVPMVTEELREIERKHQQSLALTQRKRSSRLLLRQSEKEEAEAAARKLAEEEEKNSRAKRLAARLKKEEEDRERRETSREMRRREREEREQRERGAKEGKAKTTGTDGDASSDMQVDVVGDSNGSGMIKLRLSQPKYNGLPHNGKSTGSGSGSRTPIGDDWELDCEICHQRGINLDDGTPMMSCGMCSKWQHIACHDRADIHAGRKRRNWDDVEFLCLQCRSRSMGARGVDPRSSQRLQPPAATVVQPPRQSQNPYMVHTAAGAVPFNPNLYMGAGHANYGVHGPVNGNGTSYAREAQVSHARSTPSASSAHPQQQRQVQHQPHTQQPYGSAIAFSHYQPQERGFSTTSSNAGTYAASAHTQPYGQQQHAGGSTNPYMQYGPAATPSGGAQLYQQVAQNRWNVTTPAQVPGYPATVPSYTPPGNSPASAHYAQGVAPSANPQGGSQWQHQPQAQSGIPQQNATQFRHHPTSYQHPAAPS